MKTIWCSIVSFLIVKIQLDYVAQKMFRGNSLRFQGNTS